MELWLVAKTWAQVGFVKSGSITKMFPKMHCLYSCGSEMEEVGFQEYTRLPLRLPLWEISFK